MSNHRSGDIQQALAVLVVVAALLGLLYVFAQVVVGA